MSSSRLVVTPYTADRYVGLGLYSFPAGQTITLWRDDVNGTNKVRTLMGAKVSGAGTYFLRDYEAALTGTVSYRILNGTRTNELTNPSAEVDVSGWYVFPSGALTRTTAYKWTGNAAFLMTTTDQLSSAASLYQTVPAAAGEMWTASAYLRATTGTAVQVGIEFRQGTTTLSQTFKDYTPGSDWSRGAVSASAPTGTDGVIMWVRDRTSPGSQNVYFDGVMLERSPVAGVYLEGTGTGEISSPTTTLASSTRAQGIYLRPAVNPGAGEAYATLLDWQLARTAPTLHRPIDRPDPVDTALAATLREGTVSLLVDDWPKAAALEALVMPRTAASSLADLHRCVVLRQAGDYPGMDGVYYVRRLAPRRAAAGSKRWQIDLDLAETVTGPPLAA